MKRTLRNDQTGMVAIIVTMIMMFVITLIVLGFADVSRRDSREALDTQLGTQAYYAAETGVNDVVNSIKGGLTPMSTSCNTFPAHTSDGATTTLPRALSGTTVSNTCLMVNANPTSLIAQSLAPATDSVVWDVKDVAGASFTSMDFSWQPDVAPSSTACSSSLGSYPTVANWNCNYALLRVDIVPAPAAGTTLDAASLADNTATLYLQPGSGSASEEISDFGADAAAYQAPCAVNSGTCHTTLSLTDSASQQEYYVRLTSLYRTANKVTLTGNGGSVHFSDGQIVIDSTGRAQDQLKRIQVRISQTENSDLPAFAVQGSQTICKDISILGTSKYSENCPSWTAP